MRIITLALTVILAACATTPQALKEQVPDFEHSMTGNLQSTSECLVRKIESYPILVGFSFENRGLPVQMRSFKDSIELFQMQNAYVATTVVIQKSNQNSLITRLFVNRALATHKSTVASYSDFIKNCH